MLEEAGGVDEGLEGLGRDEAVVHAVDLAGARGARRAGYREDEGARVPGEEEVVEGSLADARGAGDY